MKYKIEMANFSMMEIYFVISSFHRHSLMLKALQAKFFCNKKKDLNFCTWAAPKALSVAGVPEEMHT